MNRVPNYLLRRLFLRLLLFFVISFYIHSGFAQVKDLEFKLDLNSKPKELPPLFSPSVDLSGRGYHTEVNWPYHLANKEVISRWQSEIGFNKGFFRFYFNLWEIESVRHDSTLQREIFSNYEKIIKAISEAGGKVMLVIYGVPPGWGKVLDKKSPPLDFKYWQKYIKEIIRYFSIKKRYNIWYEVWSAPDSEDFFLGTKKDYFQLYEVTAKAIKELENENNLHIPIGGPGSSSWFRNFGKNTIFSAENSLIYELIKFCHQKNLPLDFISWHAFSDDPLLEKEITVYWKYPAHLIRDWLNYFHMNRDIPLIISEWNYDNGSNWTKERAESSYIVSSFIPQRLKGMFEAGIDYQIYFCLEDFRDNKEGININRGLFSYSSNNPLFSNAKSIYNLFLFLNLLGDKMYGFFSLDEFVQILVTRRNSDIIILISNYIDPHLGKNYILRNLSSLNEKDRRLIVQLFKSLELDSLIEDKVPLNRISMSDKFRSIFKKAKELQRKANFFKDKKRYLRLNLINLKGNYLYQRYSINQQCSWDCVFSVIEEKIIDSSQDYQESLELTPYSVELLILRKE
ncbi:MAG: hypothetical protein NC826_04590 [Candidatus Omnitrophica bacterium]|nr:hypothetical protein [Candidatus Omnitrophota bacterium]